jgi:3'-phosphoadenosine 5'-phosphosulfate sulfotransferase (PAPS reductase)/FAD synthetase
MNEIMIKQCSKCLLPHNYLNIEIDSEGICQHCRNYQPITFLGEEALREVIKKPMSLNSSKKYDCVVGFSGGRDSTYLLWYVVKVLKLRALAVFSDDLFIPEVVLDNIENTCKILGVELRAIKHDNLKKCITHHLNAWIKRPVPESLMFLNVGERIGYETFVELEAIKEGVHLVFGGRTPIQSEAQYKTELMKFNNKGGRLSWMAGYAQQVISNPSLALNLFSLKTQYKEFMVGKWKKKLIKKNNLTIVQPFYEYIQWREKDVEDVLFNELNWESPKGDKQTSRVGCEVDTLRQYLFYRTLGYNDNHVDLSGLIRDGQLTRDEALEKLRISLNISLDEIRYILTKAGVNVDVFLKKLDDKYPVNSLIN